MENDAKKTHYSTQTGEWERCRAATRKTCPYADSHAADWTPPEGAQSREDWLLEKAEAKAAHRAAQAVRRQEQTRRNQAAYRARLKEKREAARREAERAVAA